MRAGVLLGVILILAASSADAATRWLACSGVQKDPRPDGLSGQMTWTYGFRDDPPGVLVWLEALGRVRAFCGRSSPTEVKAWGADVDWACPRADGSRIRFELKGARLKVDDTTATSPSHFEGTCKPTADPAPPKP